MGFHAAHAKDLPLYVSAFGKFLQDLTKPFSHSICFTWDTKMESLKKSRELFAKQLQIKKCVR